MFLFGLTMVKGITNTLVFFFKQGKIIASIIYFAGFFLIIIKWSLIGLIIQLSGIYMLFKYFSYLCFRSTIMGAVGIVKPSSSRSSGRILLSNKIEGMFSSFISVITGAKSPEDTV